MSCCPSYADDFPQIPVIATSGEFEATGPFELLADAFFKKGDIHPAQLFSKIATLLRASPIWFSLVKPDCAPVWTPINELGYFVLTCSEGSALFQSRRVKLLASYAKRCASIAGPKFVISAILNAKENRPAGPDRMTSKEFDPSASENRRGMVRMKEHEPSQCQLGRIENRTL